MIFFSKSKDNNIFFIRLQKGQTFYWHYVAVAKSKIPLLDKLNKNSDIDLSEFGRILDSGWGLYPSADITAKYPEIKI